MTAVRNATSGGFDTDMDFAGALSRTMSTGAASAQSDQGNGNAASAHFNNNSHIVIPLMTFVFGFPVLVITVLCLIQQRNKWLYERRHMRLQQQRSSAASTVFTAYPSSRALAACDGLLQNGKEPESSAVHNDALLVQQILRNQKQIYNQQCQRPSRKPSAIRFAADALREEMEEGRLKLETHSDVDGELAVIRCTGTEKRLSGSHSPLPVCSMNPESIFDSIGYVDA